jgi:hypothetical protein
MSRLRIFHSYLDVTSCIISAYGLWAGRDLYRATPAVTWTSVLRAAPFSRLWRQASDTGDIPQAPEGTVVSIFNRFCIYFIPCAVCWLVAYCLIFLLIIFRMQMSLLPGDQLPLLWNRCRAEIKGLDFVDSPI